ELRAQEEGSLGCFSAGLGYLVSARFAIGATVEILSGGNERTEDSTFPWNDSSAYYIYKPGYRSAAMSLGIMLAPVPWWRIGLLLRTPQKISIKERSQGTETAGWEKFEYSSQGPFYLRAGTSLSLGPWLVAADAYWFDYSQIKFESDLWDYDGDVPVEPIDIGINDDLRRHYNSVLGFAVGSEYLLPVFNAKVRAGYRYDPAFKDSQGSDGLTAISVGFSVVPVPQLRVDFAAVQTSWALEMEEQWIVTNYSVNLLFRL
ncbi:MAG: hypothetical protein KAU50_02270, partial [Candidatus Marinimicrobia bacterium]|nr:hypothetical protein [Candidatus Neomarinimicrobiota bacterium]